MARAPFNPNKVDWSGENPGMYLKETADGGLAMTPTGCRIRNDLYQIR